MSSTRTRTRGRGGRGGTGTKRNPYTLADFTPSTTRVRAREGQRQRLEVDRRPSPPSFSPDSDVALASEPAAASHSLSGAHSTGGDYEDLVSVRPDPLPGLEPIPATSHPVETIAIPNTPGIVIEITENLGDMGASRLVFRDSEGIIIPPPSYIQLYDPYYPDYICQPQGADGEWYYMLNQEGGFHIRDTRIAQDIFALAPILDMIFVE
ncbi:unnamed protein product [Peniophora sp. CBMAI 1063]|nr:unnamed protein product [Peniophora sp. CBMAI 1063]